MYYSMKSFDVKYERYYLNVFMSGNLTGLCLYMQIIHIQIKFAINLVIQKEIIYNFIPIIHNYAKQNLV